MLDNFDNLVVRIYTAIMGIKYKVNEDFFKKWSYEMAYVLGFIFADGSLEDVAYIRGQYLRFHNTDYEIINKIKHTLGSEHKIVCLPSFKNRKMRFMLRIGSHKIFGDLSKFNLYPNKSLDLDLPPIPKKYFGSFLRGYFDGDGCIYVEKPKRILKVIFTSGCKRFLVELSAAISQNVRINLHKVVDNRRSYQLRYSQRDGLKILKYIYKNIENRLYLIKKYNIYQEFCKSRMKNGHVVK